MPNRLAGQTSPYLLQHARNPVDWWPWGPEAFAEARRRDVPILLSIGYSTCYWCHVMERESFENAEVAAVINREVIPIKLDREERPDVDDLYMAATLIVRGQGGWPMNCFLEPRTLKPFFCGTYFPPEPRGQMPGFVEIVERVGAAWRTQRDRIVRDAETIADAVREQAAEGEAPVDVGPAQVSQAVEMLLRMADRNHGGFGGAPKFPQPALLEFLMDVRPRAGDAETGAAIDAVVRRTLDAMACGGVRDQIGGGFHRYAVDSAWLVPHFEKMLYDNAQLAGVYAHAATLYGDPEYARVAKETIDYVLREMTEPGGAFYSAQDAEVDHREGLNYLWTPEQVRDALPPEDAEWAINVYGLDKGPNFQDPHHPGDPPANVLRLASRPEQLAGDLRLTREQFILRLGSVNAALYAARARRKQPHLDDKIIASWNGMMIAACARVGRLLEVPSFVEAGERAADRVLGLLSCNGGLRRVARDGVAGSAEALLEDLASLSLALLELARARPARSDLVDRAATLATTAMEQFRVGHRFYDTPASAPDLFVRSSSIHDGATPSAVSVMLHALADLAELTGRTEFADAAVDGLRAHSARVAGAPAGAVNSVLALFRLLVSRPEVRTRLAPGGGGTGVPAPVPTDRFTPVMVYADTDRVAVGNETPGVVHLGVQIAPGHHVVAAEPGPDAASLIPFRVGIAGGGGVAAFADYPAGSAVVSAPGGPLCYQDRFELVVVLERAGDWTGRPMLVVTFQACTDTECLAPATIELDVAIDPA